MGFDQWWIVLWQLTAFGLLAHARPEVSKWGYPACLVTQPAYFYACAAAGQWGMLALTAYITATMGWGTYVRFWRNT